MNRNWMRLTTALLLMVSLFNLSSCGLFKKSSRKKHKTVTTIIAPTDTSQIKQVEKTEVDQKLSDKYASLWKEGLDFKTFSGKAKCHYEGNGQNYDFTAHIRIKKGEAAWVMVTALGGIVQVARVFVTPDSFQMINYLEKSYFSRSSSEANNVLPFPVNFSMLQNLLIGNSPLMDGSVIRTTEDNSMVALGVKKDNMNQNIIISKTSQNIDALQLSLDNSASTAAINLTDYTTQDGRKFPENRTIHVVNDGMPYYLEMDYTDANFDGNVDMPFSVPKSYERK